MLCAKARALLHGRLSVSREDVEALLDPVLTHRVLLSFHAEAEKKTVSDITQALLSDIAIPNAELNS